jgi:hypothetical protein
MCNIPPTQCVKAFPSLVSIGLLWVQPSQFDALNALSCEFVQTVAVDFPRPLLLAGELKVK